MTPTEFLNQLGEALKANGYAESFEIGQQTLVGSINFYVLSLVPQSGMTLEIRCSHELSSDVLSFREPAPNGLKVDLHEPPGGGGVLAPEAIELVLAQFRR